MKEDKNLCQNGVKSDLAFCLGPFIGKTVASFSVLGAEVFSLIQKL